MHWEELFNNLKKPGNKKLKNNILLLFWVGVAMLVAGNIFFKPAQPQSQKEPIISNEVNEVSYSNSSEEDLEKRLENILSDIDGAGEVKVMISISTGSEKTLAQEIKREASNINEASAQGETLNEKYENTIVLTENSKGDQEPVVIKETAPKVEGVLVLAQGGDDITVKESISNACQALFDVPAHKVEILKMK